MKKGGDDSTAKIEFFPATENWVLGIGYHRFDRAKIYSRGKRISMLDFPSQLRPQRYRSTINTTNYDKNLAESFPNKLTRDVAATCASERMGGGKGLREGGLSWLDLVDVCIGIVRTRPPPMRNLALHPSEGSFIASDLDPSAARKYHVFAHRKVICFRLMSYHGSCWALLFVVPDYVAHY